MMLRNQILDDLSRAHDLRTPAGGSVCATLGGVVSRSAKPEGPGDLSTQVGLLVEDQEHGVPVNRVTQILNGQRGITADTALRLGQ